VLAVALAVRVAVPPPRAVELARHRGAVGCNT
jgi:hypothetical protein